MAKIDTDSGGDKIINVDDVVGFNGGNLRNDVTVVQALLKYFSRSPQRWTGQSLPEPIGILDMPTRQAIFDYQAFVRRTKNQFYWVAKDGRIGPYKKGVQLLNKQEWTIISLNMDCAMLAAGLQEGNHVDAICLRWPFSVGMVLGQFKPNFL
jgi:hypothetical protein